jgi:hypothetical protein
MRASRVAAATRLWKHSRTRLSPTRGDSDRETPLGSMPDWAKPNDGLASAPAAIVAPACPRNLRRFKPFVGLWGRRPFHFEEFQYSIIPMRCSGR